jgi:hypothetical protein
MADPFDPYAIMQALDRHRVTYVMVGALGRVLHGTGELTDGLDIVPSMRDENLRRLALALEELDARRPDGKQPKPERDLVGGEVLALDTVSGALKIVPEPAGTRGYDDLRRRAERLPVGHGLRPAVASMDDHARMLAALARERDRGPLERIQRLIELEHGRRRGLTVEL